VLGICAIVFAAGMLQGQPVLLMFLTAVSLAVAAIPEALPAVKTHGSVTYICADKIGTLTWNRMFVEAYYADGEQHTAFPVRESGTAWTDGHVSQQRCSGMRWQTSG